MNKKMMINQLLLLTLFLAAPLLGGPALAQSGHNDGCTNATLTGDYAFRISGQVLLPGAAPVDREGISMTHFDGFTGPNGLGGLSQVDFVMSNGAPLPGIPDPLTGFHTGETGWYRVFTDCTGIAEIDFPTPPGGTSGAVIDLMFVLSNHGRTIHTIVSQLTPPNTKTSVPVSIHSDGEKLGTVPDNEQ
jgi:hypothetical protein